MFFDNILLNKNLLIDAEVLLENINQGFNFCTMCDDRFYSARRDGGTERNITVVYFE